jgi:hypothetical protein
MGWRPGCNAPAGGPTRRSCRTPSGVPTPPRAWRCRPSTAICCGVAVAGPGAAMSTSAGGLGRACGPGCHRRHRPGRPGIPRMAKARARWHAPIGDRRTKDQRTQASATTTASRPGCAPWWSRRSGSWPTRGRCGAGVACCAGSGTSTGPPRRSSAWADGSTASRHERSIRTPSLTNWSTCCEQGRSHGDGDRSDRPDRVRGAGHAAGGPPPDPLGCGGPAHSAPVAATMLTLLDLVALHAFPGTAIPVGAVTVCLGGLYLVWLLAPETSRR